MGTYQINELVELIAEQSLEIRRLTLRLGDVTAERDHLAGLASAGQQTQDSLDMVNPDATTEP